MPGDGEIELEAAAAALTVTPQTLLRWAAAGRIAATSALGAGQVRFSRDDVEALAAERAEAERALSDAAEQARRTGLWDRRFRRRHRRVR